MASSERQRNLSPAVWTALVLAAGLVLGALFAVLPRPSRPGPGPGPGPGYLDTVAALDVVLSTVGMVFLGALVYVFARIFGGTGSRLSLGLTVAFTALLFQAVVSSPVLFGAFGHALGELGPFAVVADAFKAVAFGVLLYMSLQ